MYEERHCQHSQNRSSTRNCRTVRHSLRMSLNAWIFEHTSLNVTDNAKTTPQDISKTYLQSKVGFWARVVDARFMGSPDAGSRNTPSPEQRWHKRKCFEDHTVGESHAEYTMNVLEFLDHGKSARRRDSPQRIDRAMINNFMQLFLREFDANNGTSEGPPVLERMETTRSAKMMREGSTGTWPPPFLTWDVSTWPQAKVLQRYQ